MTVPHAPRYAAGRSDPHLEWQTNTLPNGITLLQFPSNDADSFSIVVAVPAGVRTEQPGECGISHLLEHCYGAGTPRFRRTAIEQIIESRRGSRGALTTHDSTIHFTTLEPDTMETILDIEADRLVNLHLTDDEISAQRAIALDELRMRTEISPAGSLVHRLLAAAYPCHPYGTAVVGRESDLVGMNQHQLMSYYRRHYVPRNVAVVIGGADPDRALDLFERYFAQLPAGARLIEKPILEPPQPKAARQVYLHPRAKVPRTAMLWKVPPVDHPDTPAILVLEQLLLSALPELQGGHWQYREWGPFTLATRADGCPAREGIEEACEAILQLVELHGPSDVELRAARAAATMRLPDPSREQINIACSLAQLHVACSMGAARMDEIVDEIAKTTAADVRRCIRAYFRSDRKTTVSMLLG